MDYSKQNAFEAKSFDPIFPVEFIHCSLFFHRKNHADIASLSRKLHYEGIF